MTGFLTIRKISTNLITIKIKKTQLKTNIAIINYKLLIIKIYNL